MANQVAIGWDNRIDSALLSGNNSPLLANLKTPDVREIWRAASVGSHAIIADFGSQIEFGGTALMNSNGLPTDTWHVRLSTSDPTGIDGNAYNSFSMPMLIDPVFSMLVHILDTPVIGRYLRVNLDHSADVVGEAGRWFAGPVWRPSRQFSYGWRPLWRDASRRSESLGQVIYIDRKMRQRGFGFTLRGIAGTEADDQVHELNRICGTSRDILVCRDIENDNLGKVTIWGLLEQPVSYPQDHPDHFVAEFELYERL